MQPGMGQSQVPAGFQVHNNPVYPDSPAGGQPLAGAAPVYQSMPQYAQPVAQPAPQPYQGMQQPQPQQQFQSVGGMAAPAPQRLQPLSTGLIPLAGAPQQAQQWNMQQQQPAAPQFQPLQSLQPLQAQPQYQTAAMPLQQQQLMQQLLQQQQQPYQTATLLPQQQQQHSVPYSTATVTPGTLQPLAGQQAPQGRQAGGSAAVPAPPQPPADAQVQLVYQPATGLLQKSGPPVRSLGAVANFYCLTAFHGTPLFGPARKPCLFSVQLCVLQMQTSPASAP